MMMNYQEAVDRIGYLESRYKAELEAAVNLVIASGLSTGHADTFPKLMEEVLITVRELERQVADLREAQRDYDD